MRDTFIDLYVVTVWQENTQDRMSREAHMNVTPIQF